MLRTTNAACKHMSRNTCEGYCFSFNLGEFNFKVLLKAPNVVFRFLEQKRLAFCEANNSHTSALYYKILSKVNKCLCW